MTIEPHLPIFASLCGNQFVPGSPKQAWATCDNCTWIPGETKIYITRSNILFCEKDKVSN